MLGCGLTNALYRGTKISFVRHVNDLFVKYGIPPVLFAAARTFPDGGNMEKYKITSSMSKADDVCSFFIVRVHSSHKL